MKSSSPGAVHQTRDTSRHDTLEVTWLPLYLQREGPVCVWRSATLKVRQQCLCFSAVRPLRYSSAHTSKPSAPGSLLTAEAQPILLYVFNWQISQTASFILRADFILNMVRVWLWQWRCEMCHKSLIATKYLIALNKLHHSIRLFFLSTSTHSANISVTKSLELTSACW